jgi:hypothetical protein
MRTFVAVFILLAVYGLATGHYGGALLASVMSCFVAWSAKELNKRDDELLADPHSAKVVPDTLEILSEQGSEGTRSTF